VSLPAFSVRQVVLVNLLFVILMFAGVTILQRIPIDLYPDISFNSAEITTVWSGASPDEVERLVSQKIEDEIQDVVGIKEMFSFSSAGLSEINVEWEETLSEIEYEAALSDLRAAIDRVDDLPDDAEVPVLRELSVSEVYHVGQITVADVAGVGEYALREVARDMKDRLERIPGLRKLELRGAREREIRVLVDKDRALQYDLTLAEISRIIEQNNQNFAGGSFTNPLDQEITVRGLGQFRSPEALARTVVKKNRDGSHVELGDVAEVRSDFAKRRIFSRFDGDRAIVLGISKEADHDLMTLLADVRGFLAGYDKLLPDGIEATLTWDASGYVGARMSILFWNLVIGIVLVVFVLWLTVGFRNALLAIVGVPFSFLTALILFPIFDITINSLSLIGFVLVSGMLVDDAIIILENIYRHVESGEPLRQAVVKGAEEVMWPVTAAIFTTMAAFIPLLTVTGSSGEFMSILPKTVIVCLLGSLLEALVILPAHYLDFGSREKAADVIARGSDSWSYRARARIERTLDAARDRYGGLQHRVLQHRYAFLAACLAALFMGVGVSRHVPLELFPGDFNQLFVSLEAPTDYGIDQTDEVVARIEKALEPLRDEISHVSTTVGVGLNSDEIPILGVNNGLLSVAFPFTHENIADPDRMLRLVRARMAEMEAEDPEGIGSLLVFPPRNGPPIGKPVAIRIQSDDYDQAKEIAAAMKADLAGMPGVFNIEDNVPVGPRELRVALDEHRASLHGLTFQDVGFALMVANEGVVPSTYKDPGSDEDVDIRVQLRGDQRDSIHELMDVDLRTREGHLVKLGDVATIELERGYQRLYHYDSNRAVVVYADVDGDQATSTSANAAMRARYRDIPERYPGANLVFGGEFQATAQAMSDIVRAIGLAVLAIYAILATQFRSYLQPLIVMSVICFSFIGVALGMFVMGYPMTMYVLFAIVGLAGIVVNDSLVLIDFVNQERAQGVPAREAVRSASRKRFRPILLTTVTTVTGLLPMALGISGYSLIFGPFAAAVVFGLVVASGLTLFVVPSLYLALEDLQRWTRGDPPVEVRPALPLPAVGGGGR